MHFVSSFGFDLSLGRQNLSLVMLLRLMFCVPFFGGSELELICKQVVTKFDKGLEMEKVTHMNMVWYLCQKIPKYTSSNFCWLELELFVSRAKACVKLP